MWFDSSLLVIFKYVAFYKEYNPVQLVVVNMDLLKENIEVSDLLKCIWINIGASVLFLASSIVVFCKREYKKLKAK